MTLLNESLNTLENEIENICKECIGPAAKECFLIVKNIQNITDSLLHNISSEKICEELKFCNSTI